MQSEKYLNNPTQLVFIISNSSLCEVDWSRARWCPFLSLFISPSTPWTICPSVLTHKQLEPHECVPSTVVSSYWCTDAKAPHHVYPKCWLYIHCLGALSYKGNHLLGMALENIITFSKTFALVKGLSSIMGVAAVFTADIKQFTWFWRPRGAKFVITHASGY